MCDVPDSVEDIYFREYFLTDEISRGGQGVVYRTKDPDIAVKLELDGGRIARSPEENGKYMRICYLPVPEGLHITRPLTVLKDVTGYTMVLLADMVSFSKSFSRTPDEIPENKWIDQTFSMPEQQGIAEIFRKYYATGGSRRRLQAYWKAANIFAQLHENGLVYGDLNAENLFISSDVNAVSPEVWIIDADNMNYASLDSPGYHTQLYCAPEAHWGEFSFASDCYAFAELLFEHLTMRHPFIGQQYDEWDEFDGPVEDEIASGRFAWILDEEDDSNAWNPYLPPSYYITDEIMDFFQRTFSEAGRNKPAKRPSMAEWSRALARQLDNTVVCPGCRMGYNALSHDACPWCDGTHPVLTVRCIRSTEGSGVLSWVFHREIKDGVSVQVPMRAAGGFVQDEGSAFCVIAKDETLRFSGFHPEYSFVFDDNGNKRSVSGELVVKPGIQKFFVKDRRDGFVSKIEVQIDNGP